MHVIMKGALEKKAKLRWPMRWCVLTKHMIMIFRSRKENLPVHVIQLEYVL
jgi:hypothetical protein